MGFTEEVSDVGSITGHGKRLLRGIVCGLVTTAEGIGHTFLDSIFSNCYRHCCCCRANRTSAHHGIRKRYADTPFLRVAFQVIAGGVLAFLVGICIGSSKHSL